MASPVKITVPSGDPDRTYSLDEEQRLTENLHVLLTAVHVGEFARVPVGVKLLQALHRNIFHGVRSHAGRCRGPDFGSEHLVFGPHRSVGRADVPRDVTAIFEAFDRTLIRLESDPNASDYESGVLRAALRLHADVIRVHPFEDGNGRSGRALMDVVLVRLGLRPLPIEVPKQEYLASLNHYYQTGDLDALQDMALRIYALP